MKKRMISLLLAIVMVLGMLPAMVPAASAADVKDEINIIRLVGPKNGRYLDFECGVSLLGVKVDGIRWVDHTAGERYEIEYPGTHEPVEVVAGHEYRVVIFMSTTDGSVFPDPDDITASIPGADSVFAGHVGGEGADTVCVTGYFTATQGDSDIIGVKASGDGYYWNREGEAVLNLNMDSQAFLYDDGSIGPVEGTRMGSLYTDQALTKPATSMEVGETYYFEYTLWHKSGEVNKVEDYDSSLDFEGFSNGTVIKTTTGGNNNITMLCSIVYGDMNVDKVEAVGTGYGYDSEKGAYAPIFESIKAYNADGIEFDYDGFTWSTPFYTKSSFSSANKLTYEPQNGETYYFGIYIDQYLDGMSYGYTGSLELMDNSVVTIPGFDVECVGFMEREMGSYLELTYAATKKDPVIYVGGVVMHDGDYLAEGASATQTTKPSGGYAYYKDGTLTLNNYSYEGKGYLYNSSKGWYATVYAEHDLTVELVGTNSLKQTASESEGIRVGVFDSSEKLTIQGDGSLNVTSTYCGILAWGSITVNGGTVTATGIEKAIQFSTGFTVAAGMNIQASTTVDGELGEYVAENHNSYKKIVLRSAPNVYVGGVGMYDGDYLAVGATTAQTTKPSGGYAYYKDGVLTLNNYSYEGMGYQYNVSGGYCAVIYAEQDISINLTGNNTLTQTKTSSNMIYVYDAALTVGGNGKLIGTAGECALFADGDVTINGGNIALSTNYITILSNFGDIFINGGDVTAESEYRPAIYAENRIRINGGNVTAKSVNAAGMFARTVTVKGGNVTATSEKRSAIYDYLIVAEGMKIQASTTVDGELGEYVAENHDTYKKIVIMEKPVNPFTDVNEGDFYYDPVMWAVQNGITTGATATTFNPGGNCLRAHVVTFLHRAEGNPEPTSTKNPFTDVKTSDFFYKPVLWAVEKGITNGTSATTFGSYDNCNRAAVVTFLWRNAGSPEPKSTNNPFVDVKSTDFFYKPVLWAVEQGITNGLDATHFGPATACNRAQVVTFLYRAYN